MRNTNHDELNSDARNPDKVPAIMDCLNEQRLRLRVPILWSGQTGANWAEAK